MVGAPTMPATWLQLQRLLLIEDMYLPCDYPKSLHNNASSSSTSSNPARSCSQPDQRAVRRSVPFTIRSSENALSPSWPSVLTPSIAFVRDRGACLAMSLRRQRTLSRAEQTHPHRFTIFKKIHVVNKNTRISKRELSRLVTP